MILVQLNFMAQNKICIVLEKFPAIKFHLHHWRMQYYLLVFKY